RPDDELVAAVKHIDIGLPFTRQVGAARLERLAILGRSPEHAGHFVGQPLEQRERARKQCRLLPSEAAALLCSALTRAPLLGPIELLTPRLLSAPLGLRAVGGRHIGSLFSHESSLSFPAFSTG